MNTIQLQYQGYLQTPLLWQRAGPYQLEQLALPPMAPSRFDQKINENLRLGKRVERFVGMELMQHPSIQILAENVQIQKDKLTLGELDCLLLWGSKPVHLEVVYKFYLYDPKTGKTPLEHWIGPNRRDALVFKLVKLKEKQLPLLYHQQTQGVLARYGLQLADIAQKVLFKAQLFTPWEETPIDFNVLNTASVYGRYLHFDQLHQLEKCKFYIPRKHDWLVVPHTHKPWLNFADAKAILEGFMRNESAPLVWVKDPKGNISKIFVVWWE